MERRFARSIKMRLHHVRGFTLIELMIVLAILSGIAMTIAPQIVQQKIPMDQVSEANNAIAEIKAAANAYYMENRAWPTNVNKLFEAGYYPGTGVSPFGHDYVLTTNDESMFLSISVDTGRDQLANMLAAKLPFGSISGQGDTIVTTKMGTPTRVAIQSYFLARKEVAGCDKCNQLADDTDINVNNNDLKNIYELDADIATIKTATITEAIIKTTLDVNRIILGDSSISISENAENELDINAQLINMHGQLALNNHDITGIKNLGVDKGTIATLISEEGKIDKVSGAELDFDSGKVKKLIGISLKFKTGEINNLVGKSITYDKIEAATVKGKNSEFNNLSTQYLSVEKATIKALTFKKIIVDTFIATNATLATVKTNSHSTNFLTTGNFSANSVNVTGDFRVGGNVTATNVTVSNVTKTNKMQASTSSLGQASASSLNISGDIKANDLKTTSLTADYARLKIVSGVTAGFNTVTADQFKGGTYKGRNFTTSISSVNNNKKLIDAYKAQWDRCVADEGCQ